MYMYTYECKRFRTQRIKLLYSPPIAYSVRAISLRPTRSFRLSDSAAKLRIRKREGLAAIPQLKLMKYEF